MNIKVVGTLDFKDNQEFRDFLGKRISGAGPVYIQIVDDWNDPGCIMNSKYIPLTSSICKMYKEGPYTSLIFDKSKLKEMLGI
jgi:hypothetical protein